MPELKLMPPNRSCAHVFGWVINILLLAKPLNLCHSLNETHSRELIFNKNKNLRIYNFAKLTVATEHHDWMFLMLQFHLKWLTSKAEDFCNFGRSTTIFFPLSFQKWCVRQIEGIVWKSPRQDILGIKPATRIANNLFTEVLAAWN